MKAVICADLHIDGRHDTRKTLSEIIDRTRESGADILFIAGDLFETRNLKPDTVEFVCAEFGRVPETYIFIAPGNNDPLESNSPYTTVSWPSNVIIFGNPLEVMEIEISSSERIRVYGVGASTACMSRNIFKDGIPVLDYEYINILLAHTSLESHSVNPISQKQLNEIGFDLCIFGHIHKYSGVRPTKSTSYLYPGHPAEMGGILVGDIQKGEQHLLRFVPGDEISNRDDEDESEIEGYFTGVPTEPDVPDVPDEWRLGIEIPAKPNDAERNDELVREKRVLRVRQLKDRLESLRFESATIQHYTAIRKIPAVIVATVLIVLDILALLLLIAPDWLADKIIYQNLTFLKTPYEFATGSEYYIYIVAAGIAVLLLLLMLVFYLSSMGAKKYAAAQKRIEIQKNRLAEVILPEVTEVIDGMKDSESQKSWGKRDIFTENNYEFLEVDDEVLDAALKKFEQKYRH